MIEPAERWYEAAALDVETSFTLTAWRTKTGIATPRFLFLWQQFHDERDQIVTAWEQAKARGDDGRRDRIAAADRMIRFAFVVHEQLPGAPPAPHWLELVARRKAEPPKPAITLGGEVVRTVKYAFGQDDDKDKKTDWTTIALILGGAYVLTRGGD